MNSTWYLLGAGSMGTLAAHYLQQAGARVLVANRPAIERELLWPDSDKPNTHLTLLADDHAPIERLLIATKGPDTFNALAPLLARLSNKTTIVCLQNGMGTLDNLALPQQAQLLYAVTTNAAWRDKDRIHVVAENTTLIGALTLQPPPQWHRALAVHWPRLSWSQHIAYEQWRKLTINAVINPLTAMYDCLNGELLERTETRDRMRLIASECDTIANLTFPDWPQDTLARATQIAHATARNTSSMRADFLAKRPTEINFINGYLVKVAEEMGFEAKENRRLVEQLSRPLQRH